MSSRHARYGRRTDGTPLETRARHGGALGQDTGAADLASVSEQRESVPWRTRGAPPLDGCVRAWRETSASLPPAVKCAPLVADCCAANQHRLAGPNQHRRAPHGLEVRNPNEVAGQGWRASSLHSFRRLWGSTGPLLFHLLEVPETLPSPTPSIFKAGNGQLSLCRPHHRGPASLFHSEGRPCDDPGPTM